MTWCAVGKFEDDVRKFERKTEKKMKLVVRKVMLEIIRKIILKTPVDKGTLRANWQLAIGNVPNGTLELNDKTGTATVSKAAANSLGYDLGDTIYLANNLPYVRTVEEGGYKDGPKTVGGFSLQAPAGMVGLTLQEFQGIVKRAGIELSFT